jgi:hypothetical protein
MTVRAVLDGEWWPIRNWRGNVDHPRHADGSVYERPAAYGAIIPKRLAYQFPYRPFTAAVRADAYEAR